MAITAQNISYQGRGPVAGGSTILAFGGSSTQELSYIGTVSFVGDGATTTAVFNYVDGTNLIGFVPTAVVAVRTGGTAAASIVSYATDNANAGLSGTITFSAAPANAATITYALFVLK